MTHKLKQTKKFSPLDYPEWWRSNLDENGRVIEKVEYIIKGFINPKYNEKCLCGLKGVSHVHHPGTLTEDYEKLPETYIGSEKEKQDNAYCQTKICFSCKEFDESVRDTIWGVRLCTNYWCESKRCSEEVVVRFWKGNYKPETTAEIEYVLAKNKLY